MAKKILTQADLRRLETSLTKATDLAARLSSVGRSLSSQIKRATMAIQQFRQEELPGIRDGSSR